MTCGAATGANHVLRRPPHRLTYQVEEAAAVRSIRSLDSAAVKLASGLTVRFEILGSGQRTTVRCVHQTDFEREWRFRRVDNVA